MITNSQQIYLIIATKFKALLIYILTFFEDIKGVVLLWFICMGSISFSCNEKFQANIHFTYNTITTIRWWKLEISCKDSNVGKACVPWHLSELFGRRCWGWHQRSSKGLHISEMLWPWLKITPVYSTVHHLQSSRESFLK